MNWWNNHWRHVSEHYSNKFMIDVALFRIHVVVTWSYYDVSQVLCLQGVVQMS